MSDEKILSPKIDFEFQFNLIRDKTEKRVK